MTHIFTVFVHYYLESRSPRLSTFGNLCTCRRKCARMTMCEVIRSNCGWDNLQIVFFEQLISVHTMKHRYYICPTVVYFVWKFIPITYISYYRERKLEREYLHMWFFSALLSKKMMPIEKETNKQSKTYALPNFIPPN